MNIKPSFVSKKEACLSSTTTETPVFNHASEFELDFTPITIFNRTVFAVPGFPGEAYFLHGATYARVSFVPSSPTQSIVFGPTTIADYWKPLMNAGFDTIDAVLPNRNDTGDTYIFNDKMYVRYIHVPQSRSDEGTTGQKIVSGPHPIDSQWKTLAKSGIETIDAILPVPSFKEDTYFFSGDTYVRIKYVTGTASESIVSGPHKIAGQWKTLVVAGFTTMGAVCRSLNGRRRAKRISSAAAPM